MPEIRETLQEFEERCPPQHRPPTCDMAATPLPRPDQHWDDCKAAIRHLQALFSEQLPGKMPRYVDEMNEFMDRVVLAGDAPPRQVRAGAAAAAPLAPQGPLFSPHTASS